MATDFFCSKQVINATANPFGKRHNNGMIIKIIK